MRVKDWSIVDLNKTEGTPGSPQCASVTGHPTLNANTLLKAISGHESKRLEYRWLEQDRGDTRLPPVCQCHRTPNPQCQYPAKAISGHESERLEYRWLEQDRGDTRLPPVCQCHRTPNPQCQYPAKSHFWPWEWKTGVSLTWTRQRGHQAPPSVPVSQDTQPSMPIPC